MPSTPLVLIPGLPECMPGTKGLHALYARSKHPVPMPSTKGARTHNQQQERARASLTASALCEQETALFGARGHIPQNIIVSLIGDDGRPLGIVNNVVFWETHMPHPPRPGPKPTTNATSLHKAPWDPDAGQRAHERVLWGEFWLRAPPMLRAAPGFRVALVVTSCVAVDGRLTLLEET
eukprot:3476619-Rhodomonas_salina.1